MKQILGRVRRANYEKMSQSESEGGLKTLSKTPTEEPPRACIEIKAEESQSEEEGEEEEEEEEAEY